MTDIVERLRDHDRHIRGRLIEGLTDLVIDDMLASADEIERLREENRKAALEYLAAEGQWREETGRLREALRDIACDCKHECADSPYMAGPITPNCCRNFARSALEEKEG